MAPADERADDPRVSAGAPPAAGGRIRHEPLHPRLAMRGPVVGRLGACRLPHLGPLPYAPVTGPAAAVTSRARPVAVVLVAGAVVASGTAVWAVRGTDTDRPAIETAADRSGSAPSSDAPTAPAGPGPTTPARGPSSWAPTPGPAPGGAPGPGASSSPSADAPAAPEAWFADGRLILVGAVPDRRIADALATRAAAIVGREAVVDGLAVDPAAPVPAGLPVVVAEQIRFGLERYDVTAQYLPLVEAWKAILEANPSVVMRITGHTDSTGPLTYNQWLSTERAAAVAGWMQDRGIDADRFVVEGRGPTEPIAANSTPAARAENRRIQVVLDGLLMV